MEDSKEIEDIKFSLGRLEDRVTTLEIVREYHKSDFLKKAIKFIKDNLEHIIAFLSVLMLNILIWDKL